LNTINDAIAFQYLGHHKRMRFAHLRVFASFGWIVAVLLVGKVYDRLGVHHLFAAYSAGILIASFFLWKIPRNEKTTWSRGLAAVRGLLTKRNVIFFLISVFIFETANHMGYTFLSVYARSLGASHFQIGWLWATATIAELFTMFAFVHIVKRINLRNILLLGMLFSILRWVPFGLMHDWWQLLPLQTLHAFTLTFGYVGATTFIDMESSQEIRFSAQAFYSTFVLNGAAIGGAVFGGQISEKWGYGSLYLISGILVVVAVVIMAVFVKNPQSQR
jgi:predicted MFS family arabinose efflux permease